MQKTHLFPLIMKGTAAVTGVVTVGLWLIGLRRPHGWILPAAITFGTTCYHFSMRLVIGLIVPKLFAGVDPAHKWFQPRSFEEGLYRLLKVRQWKKYVPTYTPEAFSMAVPPEEIARTMCVSELVHLAIVPFSFLPLLLAIPFGEGVVFLITSVIAALVDCVFILLQRYNRPRVLRILAKRRSVIE